MRAISAHTAAAIAQYVKSHRRQIRISAWIGTEGIEGWPSAAELAERLIARFGDMGLRLADDGPASRYAQALAQIPPASRRFFLRELRDTAPPIPWTHLSLAQLAGDGWLNLILATGSDDLIERAFHLAGVPLGSVVDGRRPELAVDGVRSGSVVRLEGLGENAYPFIGDDDDKNTLATLRQAVYRAAADSVMIVARYDGRGDPLFELLCDVGRFGHGLYWIGRDERPPADAAQRLFSEKRNAHYLGGRDADAFLLALTRDGLGLPEPALFADPEEYVRRMQAQVAPRPAAPYEEPVADEIPVLERPPRTTINLMDGLRRAAARDVARSRAVDAGSKHNGKAQPRRQPENGIGAPEVETIEETLDETPLSGGIGMMVEEVIVEGAAPTNGRAQGSRASGFSDIEDAFHDDAVYGLDNVDAAEPSNGKAAEDVFEPPLAEVNHAVAIEAREAADRGEFDRFILLCDEALDTRVKDYHTQIAMYAVTMGNDMLARRKYYRAGFCFDRAASLDPDNSDAFDGLATVAKAKGDSSGAERYSAKADSIKRTR